MLPEQQQRIMGYFIEEAKEHLNTIEHGLLNLQSTIEDNEAMNEVFRAAHSVKGGAAMLGLSSIQKTAHRLEDYFKILKETALIKVDQKLESLFLRIYDALSELVAKLENRNLTDETADVVMQAVDPTFAELSHHLDGLVEASIDRIGSSAPSELRYPSKVSSASIPMTQEASALLLTFQSDVPASLKEMLQNFKQSDNETSRQALQEIALRLERIGEQFDLPTWSRLVRISRQVLNNLDHSYGTIAPVLIREIKQAQELVVAGRATEILPSEVLLKLRPPEAELELPIAVYEEPVLLDSPEIDSGLDSFNGLGESFDGLFNGDEADSAIALDPLNSKSSIGLPILDEELDDLAVVDYPGPEVGIVELNSLADLFEGEVLDLGSAWQETDSFGSSLLSSTDVFNNVDPDSIDDFDDLLFETSNDESTDFAVEEQDELVALFGDETLIQGDTDTWIQKDFGHNLNPDSFSGFSPSVGMNSLGMELEDISFEQESLRSSNSNESVSALGDQANTNDELEDLLSEATIAPDLGLDLIDPDSSLDFGLAEQALGDFDDMFGESSVPDTANLSSLTAGLEAEQSLQVDALWAADEPLIEEPPLFGDDELDVMLTEAGADLATALPEPEDLDDLFGEPAPGEEVDDLSQRSSLSAIADDPFILSENSLNSFDEDLALDAFALDDAPGNENLDVDNAEVNMASLPDDSLIDFDILSELDFDQPADGELSQQPQGEDVGIGAPVPNSEMGTALEQQHEVDELDALMGDDFGEIGDLQTLPEALDTDFAGDLGDGLFEDSSPELTAGQELTFADQFDLFEDANETSSAESFEMNLFSEDPLADLFDAEGSGDRKQAMSLEAGDNRFDQQGASSAIDETMGNDEDINLDLFGDLSSYGFEGLPVDQTANADNALEDENWFSDESTDRSELSESNVEDSMNGFDGLLDTDENFAESLLEISAEDQPQVEETEISLDDLDEMDGDFMNASMSDALFEHDQGDQLGQAALEDLDDLFSEDILGGEATPETASLEPMEMPLPDLDGNDLDGLADFLNVASFGAGESDETDLRLDFDAQDSQQHPSEIAGEAAFLSEAGEVDGLDDLDGMLAGFDDNLLGENGNTSSQMLFTDSDDLDNLLGGDALLPGEARDGFEDLGGIEADDFAGLDSLLNEPSPPPNNALTSQPVASGLEFDDLDMLLSDDIPPALPATKVSASEIDLDADLEKLMEDANRLGGLSAVLPGRGAAPARSARKAASDPTMRVPIKQLDTLSNLVGELVVNRNSLEQDQERLRQFLDNLLYQVQQLSDVGQRMRDLYERSLLESSLLASRQSYQSGSQLDNSSHSTGADFDALEMDRFTAFHSLSQEMIELIVRVRESASDIEFIINEPLDQVTRNFRQVTTQLQEGLTRSRMVPFSVTADRLPRGVRDNAIKDGKQAELVVEGRETLIDKMILEQLSDPLTHLVNNAVAHGIEKPDVRQKHNKSGVGRITVRAFHQGNQTVISVSDDGAGINTDLIKRKAIEKGLISVAQAQTMSRSEVYDILFLPGFSGADDVNDLRGRGVGMDVVRTSLNDIRGSINIDSGMGKGTTFTIRLPLTLSISKALCCISNRARIAFPMDGVEDMLDVPRERVQTNSEGQPCIAWRDLILPFQPLADVLKYNRFLGRGSVYGGSQEDDIISIVVLRSAGNFTALQVDQVMGEQEIVIKQLQGPVPKPIGIAGATVLGDGRIMPIADVLELIDLSMGRLQPEKTWEQEETPPSELEEAPHEPTVLIVDDSITVRELLSMTFSKVGYRVEQARDGQDAWEKLRSGLPCDIVFCDIEMPRMDGLELLSRIQKETSLNHLPIAMLTSRGADRHRQMAIQMGAKGYFTKPYLEEALLDAAQRMLKGEVLVTANVSN